MLGFASSLTPTYALSFIWQCFRPKRRQPCDDRYNYELWGPQFKTMVQYRKSELGIFDKQWVERAQKEAQEGSWAHNILNGPDSHQNRTYLNAIRAWYTAFPANDIDKTKLKKGLENFSNESHLGGVNELSWWKFMCINGLKVEPVPTKKIKLPDFKILSPLECFVEVSTLNVSNTEKIELEREGGISLNHSKTLSRFILKSSNDKKEQISYAAQENKPCILVLFDFTTWSAFATGFYEYMADFLLGQEYGFGKLPTELSALVYVERKVMEDGRIALSCNRSAIYYNPSAKYPLRMEVFSPLKQYRKNKVRTEEKDPWIFLED